MQTALFVWGGWSGHQPQAMATLLASSLTPYGFTNTLVDSLEILADPAALSTYSLIVPCWTMGTLTKPQLTGLQDAVTAGVGLGGIHGGMGDAFRGQIEYEWMVGGLFVGHPHVGPYEVKLTATPSPITEGLPPQFSYQGEQYYMLVEPGLTVLAESDYAYAGRTVSMPIAWCKTWGRGRVFYASYGHTPAELQSHPPALELAVRGLRWAAQAL